VAPPDSTELWLDALPRERLGELLEQLPAFIFWMRGRDHAIEGANRAALRLVGFREVIGQPIADVVPELNQLGLIEVLDRVLATGEPYEARGMRFLLPFALGAPPEERFLDFSYRALVEPDGTRSGVLCHGMDVTANALATAALRESESHHRMVLDSLPVVVYRAEPRPPHETIYVNRAVESLGFTLEEWLARPDMWASRLHPDDRVRVRRETREAFERAQPMDTRYRMLARDGTVRWFHDRGEFVPEPDSMRCVWQGIMLDITALQESEERERLIFEEAGIGMAVCHLDGRIERANAALCEFLGYSPEQLEAMRYQDVTHPDDLVLDARESERLMAGEIRSFSCERRYRRGDGTEMWGRLTVALLRDASGTAVRRIAQVEDITERRRVEQRLRESEEQLRHTQKMEAVGRLAGGVAHDFNNLITIIRASAGFLLEDTGDADPRREDVREIAAAADRATVLTRQLLTFSRPQALERRPLDVNEIVANLQPMLGRVIGEHITVSTTLHDRPAIVLCDVGQLEQVLVNLAINARDAMPDGGRLGIDVTVASLDMDAAREHATHGATAMPGRYVRLSVWDNGVGMTGEVCVRAFEPFFTTKDPGRGTGLGLATVYGIVQQAGGHVRVDSRVGEGTVFELYIPLHEGPVGEPST
jgi:PAS domain S-box-containing protein